MFKVNSKVTDVVTVPSLLALNIVHTFLYVKQVNLCWEKQQQFLQTNNIRCPFELLTPKKGFLESAFDLVKPAPLPSAVSLF